MFNSFTFIKRKAFCLRKKFSFTLKTSANYGSEAVFLLFKIFSLHEVLIFRGDGLTFEIETV